MRVEGLSLMAEDSVTL